MLEQMLADGSADIFLHLDKKSRDSLEKEIIKHDRIKVLDQSISISWGDISMIDATLLLINEVLNAEKHYDYISLRSGQDLIVRKGFEMFLAENKGKSFINAVEISSKSSTASYVYLKWPSFMRRRYKPTHPLRWIRSLMPKLYRIGICPLPKNKRMPNSIKLYCGSQWFCLPSQLAKYIVEYLKENPWYYQAFRDSLVADECFFQTLVMNSHFASSVVNTNLTYLRMGKALKERNHPVTLTSRDISDIERSGCYFARKFDKDLDQDVISYYRHLITS